MRNWATDLGRSRAKRVRPCSAHVCICAQWRLTTYSLCLHSEVAILVCGNEKLLLSSCHAMPPIKMFPKLLLLARCSLAIPSRIPLWDSSPIVWLFFFFFKQLVAALFYILWPLTTFLPIHSWIKDEREIFLRSLWINTGCCEVSNTADETLLKCGNRCTIT